MTKHSKFVTGLFLATLLAILLFVFAIKKSLYITTAQVATPLIASDVTELPTDINDPMLGNPGADSTIVAFIDFGDAHNRQVYTTLTNFIRANPRTIRLIVKHAPPGNWLFASTHLTVQRAVLCAEKNNHFWQYADQLATIGTLWRLGQLTDAATSSGLDQNAFRQCIDSPAATAIIETTIKSVEPFTPDSPTLYINNKRLHLTKDVDLEQLLNSLTTSS